MAKVIHKRDGCIGCNTCVFDAPDFWEMADDGKANLKGGVLNAEGNYEREINPEDVEQNKRAAEDCPVSVIEVQD
jgi:ferredoxin